VTVVASELVADTDHHGRLVRRGARSWSAEPFSALFFNLLDGITVADSQVFIGSAHFVVGDLRAGG
jgi:hypothetical protein